MTRLDNRRELAEEKIATLRVEMNTAREIGAKLGKEAREIRRELGDPDAVGSGIEPASVLGRLASVRLARFRNNIDKASEAEMKLEARRVLLESALQGITLEIFSASGRTLDAQLSFERAVGALARDFPIDEGPHMFRSEVLQPVP
jgi:hypothetical protein